MNCFKSFVVFISVLGLVGCGSPKDANKENFKKTLNSYYEKNIIRISPGTFLSSPTFPLTVELRKNTHKSIEKRNLEKTIQFDELVSLGFLSVSEGTKEIRDPFASLSFGSTEKKITVPTKTYALTDKGKKIYNDGFYVGIYKVDEITNFSEPTQAMGYTVTNVNYTVSPSNISKWATKQEIKRAYPFFSKKLKEKQPKRTTLFLMNDGWVHQKDMKNRSKVNK